MTNLNTPGAVARLLAGTGFDHRQIEEALAEQFPDADLSGVTAAALKETQQWDDELDRAVQTERDAAIAAEHDEGDR